MKILILTGRFGMGHTSCANAIKEELEAANNEVVIVDLLEHLYPHRSQVVYKSFEIVVDKFKLLYNPTLKIAEEATEFRKFSIYRKDVKELVQLHQPDVIVSTIHFCSKVVSTYKELENDLIPLVTCITDISLNKVWINSQTMYYLVGSMEVKQSLIDEGVCANTIFVTGIPVKRAFKKSRHIKKNDLLIMGGGLGIIELTDECLEYLHESNLKTTVITGKNKELYHHLKTNYPKFEVHGYISTVAKHMNNSKVLISKPGGITMFEALQSKTILLVLNPELKQEKDNAQFLIDNQIGKVYNKYDKYDIIQFLDNKEEHQLIASNINAFLDSLDKNSLNDIMIMANNNVINN